MMALDPVREYTLPKEQVLEPKTQGAVERSHAIRASALERARTRDRFGLILTLLVCMGIALFLVSRYATMVSENYQIQAMQSTLSHDVTRDASLQSIVYELSSPTRILNIATNILHMSPATPVVVGSNSH